MKFVNEIQTFRYGLSELYIYYSFCNDDSTGLEFMIIYDLNPWLSEIYFINEFAMMINSDTS